jgi:hypothetical protein
MSPLLHQKKLTVIPNAVREVRTSAPFRAFRGKNPSSISNPPALGSLPSETAHYQLPTPESPEAQ